MAYCDLLDSCYFYKNELSDMPCTYKHLMNKYCSGDYVTCARFVYARAYGRNSVPLDMFPNDTYISSHTDQLKAGEPHGGLDMFLKVVYPDGILGMVKAAKLYGLINAGKIIAFNCSEGWVEVRRKNKSTYNGVDRRKTNPENFYAAL